MGQHQADQHSNYRGPRRKEIKGAENMFEEIKVEKFPNWKETDIQTPESSK